MDLPLYDYLRGNWSVNRHIDDRLTGGESIFTGTASFTGAATTLAYRETGVLSHGGTRMQAARSYLWQCQPDRAHVMFDAQRPFHEVDLKDSAATARHLCGDDLYLGSYAFEGADTWQVTWDVEGPRKHYRSVTTYRRAPNPLQ